ncbi:hypothetical protein ORL82_20215, partial [Bacillus cereus]|uniref:hypothetical protein n=1 Tax=Bacillus cereus TaxID=1396 RepID=UPI002ABF047E
MYFEPLTKVVITLPFLFKTTTACLLVYLVLPPLCITFLPVLTTFKMALDDSPTPSRLIAYTISFLS